MCCYRCIGPADRFEPIACQWSSTRTSRVLILHKGGHTREGLRGCAARKTNAVDSLMVGILALIRPSSLAQDTIRAVGDSHAASKGSRSTFGDNRYQLWPA